MRVDRQKKEAHILRSTSYKSLKYLEKIFSGTRGLLLAENDSELLEKERFNTTHGDLPISVMNVMSVNKEEAFGLCEALIGCSYQTFTTVSKSEVTCLRILADEFFSQVKDSNLKLIYEVNQKYSLFSDRIISIANIHNVEFSAYYHETEMIFENKEIMKMKMKA